MLRPLVVACFLLIIGLFATVSAQTINVTNPTGGKTESAAVPSTGGARLILKFSVSDPAGTPKIRVVDNADFGGGTADYDIKAGVNEQRLSLNLLRGVNKITLYGYSGEPATINANSPKTIIYVSCTDEDCGKSKDLVVGSTQQALGGGGGEAPAENNITIKSPTGSVAEGPVSALIAAKKGINKLAIAVYDKDGNRVDFQGEVPVSAWDDKQGAATPKLKLVSGQNLIRVVDADKPTDKASEVLVALNCTGGDKCGKAEAAAPKPKGSIKIVSAKEITYGDKKEVKIKVKVEDKPEGQADVKNLAIEVKNNDEKIKQPDNPLPFTLGGEPQEYVVKISKGENHVKVFNKDDPTADFDSAIITCDECGASDSSKLLVAVSAKKDDNGTFQVKNLSALDSLVTVPQGTTTRIRYDVYGPNDKSFDETISIPGGATAGPVEVPLRLQFFNGLNTIRIYDADKGGGDGDVSLMINCTEGCPLALGISTYSTPFTRGIIGLEQTAAASADSTQKLFLEFNLTAPLFRKKDRNGNVQTPLQAPLWLWLNPRITSMPNPRTGSVADFTTASNFFTPFTSGQVNEIAQGFEFTGGFEKPLRLSGRGYVTGSIASGFGPKTRVRFGVSAIVGGGVLTPFSVQKTIQVFQNNVSLQERFGDIPTDTTKFPSVAFVSGDRTRFLRQYFAGLRLKTYYVQGEGGDEDVQDNIFPGILDVTFGQNESITRACLCGVVTHIEGIFPLPFIKGDKRGSVYVFGSASLKLNDAQQLKPVFLVPVIPQPAVPGTGIFIKQVPAEDRDHYRLGVGVDLIRLIKRN